MTTATKPSQLPLPVAALLTTFGVLIFGYYPLLQLGSVAGIHIDLSLLYVVLAATVLLSAAALWHQRAILWKSIGWRLLLLYTLVVSTATLWSPNPTRGVVTAGFGWLLLLVVSSVLVHRRELAARTTLIKKILLGGFILVGLFSLWQLVGEAIGVAPAFTLLPDAYQSAVFGVARPTGFSLEPQFLGSLLLIPYSWALYRQINEPRFRLSSVVLLGCLTLLLMTLSRGALGAAAIATFAILVSQRTSWRNYVLPVTLGISAFVVAGGAVYGLAALNSRDTISGRQALARSTNHLSLGVIDISAPQQAAKQPGGTKRQQPPTPGYVEASTTSRLSMSEAAVELWTRHPQTTVLGVGTGGFGTALHQSDPSRHASSIVNNHYLEVLVETGLIGLGAFLAFLAYLLFRLGQRRLWLGCALLLAFVVQWFFFSGSANAVHVWMFIAVCLAVISTDKPKTPRSLSALIQ